ncbi:hypothetical protein CVT24_008041 [Panaeolus cyanescens]|uniref:HAUS augmin-like complex subunit 6 N-terminal domain-containing protein n=1 Tax=Panaeolus cyanescens TaxID=181874 RepID=A0A409YQQ0_9AGAR|nr:hypothetical protein CVT24_008041 [Panaeolus cyanescens]
MSAIISLPNSLILLVHLHLLSYPHASKPEYDENLFSSARGLRERTKTMEDVSYFLVGRLEKLKDGPKSLFPMYPCCRPSDTVAFRTTLAKYLEQLRHSAIYPTALGKSTKQKDRQLPSSSVSAKWWKDVVVRKSLLEECVGERFERLMLALSTHTLMKLSKAHPIDISDFAQELRRQPQLYHSKLSMLNAVRRQWKSRARLLEEKMKQINQLRSTFEGDQRLKAKRDHASLQSIQQLADSKARNIKNTFWSGVDAAGALTFMVTLAGLGSAPCLPTNLSTAHVEGDQSSLPASITPLPVAAAHHPAQIKKFRRPLSLFKVSQSDDKKTGTTLKANIQPYMNVEASLHRSLADAHARLSAQTELLNAELRKRLASLSLKSTPPEPYRLLGHFDANTLECITQSVIADFKTPDLSAELERRIEEIRTNILPPYPIVPDSLPERLPAIEPKTKPTTGIPQRRPQHDPANGRKTSNPPYSVKRSPRKSARFSMARQARPRVPTMRIFSGGEEVNQLINSTYELPSDSDSSDVEIDNYGTPGDRGLKTPKPKPKVNRIWTASTPGARPPSTLKHSGMASRESFPNFMEAAVSLPSLLSADMLLGDDNPDDGDESEDDDYARPGGLHGATADEMATPRTTSFGFDQATQDEDVNPFEHAEWDCFDEAINGGESHGEEYEEEDSITLNNMIQSSQEGFVDLMGRDVELDKHHSEEDGSFQWDSTILHVTH